MTSVAFVTLGSKVPLSAPQRFVAAVVQGFRPYPQLTPPWL